MRSLLNRIREEEKGATYSMEILLVATLVVIGATAGLGRVREAMATELNDLANAVGSLNQGFIVPPQDVCACKVFAAGSGFKDGLDECDCSNVDLCGQVKDHNGNVNLTDVAGSQG